MKKKLWIVLAAVIAVLGIGTAVALSGYTRVGGQLLKKGQSVYDLRSKNLSPEDYAAICEAFPDAEVLWQVRFQGVPVSEDTRELTVRTLSPEDIRILAYLPKLRVLNADECTDYDALMQVHRQYPDLALRYRVDLGGTVVGSQEEAIVLHDADSEMLMQKLPLLPAVRSVRLEGKLPGQAALSALTEAFPHVDFDFVITLGGKSYSTAEELNLYGEAVTAAELEAVLPLLGTCRIVLPEGFTQDECIALADRFPEAFFVFPYTFADKVFSTDDEEIDLSKASVTPAEAEALLSYFKALKKVIMIACGNSNEDMEALNLRHEDVRFVWTVNIAGVQYRTDMRYFYPWQQGISRKINLDCSNLRYCTDIEVVDVGHYWVTDCSFLQYTPHVKYLILAMTGCRDITPVKYLQELEYLEIFEMIVDDYSPLLECKALKDLNVGLTYADPTPLTRMTWLENLYWYGGDDYLKRIGFDFDWEAGLPDTYVELSLHRNGDKEWRYLPRYYLMRDILNTGYLNQDAARLVWGDDIDPIMDCKANGKEDAKEVIGEILARRKANGEYIPGIKNSGPMPDNLRRFLGR